jgi:hypothetical protein
MSEREPDWDAIAEQEIEARTDAILGDAPYRCSDPPEESCSDAACPVHGEDGDGTNWRDPADDDDVNYVHHIRDPKGDEAAHG